MAQSGKTRLSKLEVVDSNGETKALDVGDYAFMAIQQRRKTKEVFTMFFQEPLADLARDRELWGRPRAVLDFLASRLNYENYVAVPQVEIARELGLNRQNVNTAIKLLIDKDILIPGPKLGHTPSYRMNSRWGWRGSLSLVPERRRQEITEVFDRMTEGAKATQESDSHQLDFEGNKHPHQDPVS